MAFFNDFLRNFFYFCSIAYDLSFLMTNFYFIEKMEKNRGDLRKLLKYEFQLGHNAKEAIANINRAKGAGTVAYRTAARWISKFRSGNLDVEDNIHVVIDGWASVALTTATRSTSRGRPDLCSSSTSKFPLLNFEIHLAAVR